ncbi:hypothetical protein NP233_g4078 [Leucocoprinus birnbaumii]|uniref:VWFA domain-containing protein n=1 Tax=Leucocoprinus birnbaumii TaxID=56174 RepID=A0AAD5VZ31_9AGAR|nr:hypothetical protein NP233_g4078 [Leucocoprinus birnbaumii]
MLGADISHVERLSGITVRARGEPSSFDADHDRSYSPSSGSSTPRAPEATRKQENISTGMTNSIPFSPQMPFFKRVDHEHEHDRDIAGRVPGLYRVFDLINEQGSGGLVDKVIIDQDGLKRLINDLCPGAYFALTRVDFKALDTLAIRPIGVVDDYTVQLLRHSRDNYSGPSLRSGIYIVRPPASSTEVLYAVYWPQDETWKDSAPSGPRRKSGYLLKISDQIMCFMSTSQSRDFVWDHEDQQEEELTVEDFDPGSEERLYTFEITQENEQEESVVHRPGFRLESKYARTPAAPENEDQPPAPHPSLVFGETSQGILSVESLPPRVDQKVTDGALLPMQLRQLLSDTTLRIDCVLSEEEVSALIKYGLDTSRYRKICVDWQERRRLSRRDIEKLRSERYNEMQNNLKSEEDLLGKEVMVYLIEKVLNIYPDLDPTRLSGTLKITREEFHELRGNFTSRARDSIGENVFDHVSLFNFEKDISLFSGAFREQKQRIACVLLIRRKHSNLYSDAMAKEIIAEGLPTRLGKKQNNSWFRISLPFSSSSSPEEIDIKKAVEQYSRAISDQELLYSLDEYVNEEPLVQPATRHVWDVAHEHITEALAKIFGRFLQAVLRNRQEFARKQVNIYCKEATKESQRRSAEQLSQEINLLSSLNGESEPLLIFKSFKINSDRYGESFLLSAQRQTRIVSTFQYRLSILDLSSDHRQNIQLDHTFVPSPSVNNRTSIEFTLPPNRRILHSQLLANERVLFVVDQGDKIGLYLDKLWSMANALHHSQPKKTVDKRRLGGQDIIITFEESKRLLVLCTPHKPTLYVFMFDEHYGQLQSWASPFELSAWYNNQETVTHICFAIGTEDILLVDSRNQARIYSLVSQRFRPASISLPESPVCVMSSPDGACAFFVFDKDQRRIMAAHHWETFGSSEGIEITLPENHGSLAVTSFVDRQCIHLMMINEAEGYVQSLALAITKKSSEFTFKEKGAKVSVETQKTGNYVNNCLLDCFGDVWTRFPVVAAVSRHSITSSATRKPKKITFVSDQVHENYSSYFADMVRTFEDKTKKPTDGQLRAISINAETYSNVIRYLMNDSGDHISRFLAGQWFVNLLCLLPIHIAVARDNRFVPLKDGVSSSEFEQSLLGAEVGRIVDNLSFGWYESILRSYMADKPVKVVSSMGEQSVGKSFALNHLMDTSFAGSAMRTTEGVWMSITPTDEALLVALDFEGVHSIERSPQEDALLVLFNTAVSNLVLFRNNFALSRDIADLFQSFQASSVILDPKANPSLFQSTLVIIIKDVIESDQKDIVREFSLKFQSIVRAEQGANFISKLHAGRLNIIPWPVIESSQFYTLYSTLKRRLDSQKVTHPSAGEFLYTLKILMAKLKTNDWGAMSQSLAAHRAQSLLAMLPVALQYGLSEAGSENEPLKNLDNDTAIDCSDTMLRLFLSSHSGELTSREDVLTDLRRSWVKYDSRHDMVETTWIEELAAYLSEVVQLRISHVEKWISTNLQRFKASNTHVELLQREMSAAVVELQANVDLCKLTCQRCNLGCTLSRRHDPTPQPHDCNTDHRCPRACAYVEDHVDEEQPLCQSPAGHDGPHICVVDQHLCGEPCLYQDKKGCQTKCTKMADHEGDHVCSARKHACSKPCALLVILPNGRVKHACSGTCSYASDEPHDQHVCDVRMCPITCELCERLCGNADHLHGLDDAAIHLCGQNHDCRALCGAGICEIDTTPQSIEATFTGRHETFRYTKYSQAAKRLPCKRPIPAWKREHEGEHIHSLDPSPFHFCDIKCDNCGYFCTLPQGHPQQEHETSHGSMSKTRWAIDGPDGTVMELNGRRFGSNDEGAPMMCNLRCGGPDHEHIPARLEPNPDKPKDWISHKLYWRRSGFRDPYSRDDQATFAKCDSMCPGPEHAATANQTAQPSYCTLPLFHPPHATNQLATLGYVSNDGHLFTCKNPIVMQQAFHVIFVIDRSGSMSLNNSKPLPATPVTPTIVSRHNDRLGAAYLSLHGFWQSRQVALTTPGSSAQGQAAPARRDAYSVLLFSNSAIVSFENDFRSTPEQMLRVLLQTEANGGTNYEAAITQTEAVMRKHWSSERSPVVIFLSDGECSIRDTTVRTLCRAAISLGNESLRRMAQIAREVESSAPRDATLPANAHLESSYSEAVDSITLAETFLGLADSLKKTRGALLA